jgi:hypothetical protein
MYNSPIHDREPGKNFHIQRVCTIFGHPFDHVATMGTFCENLFARIDSGYASPMGNTARNLASFAIHELCHRSQIQMNACNMISLLVTCTSPAAFSDWLV